MGDEEEEEEEMGMEFGEFQRRKKKEVMEVSVMEVLSLLRERNGEWWLRDGGRRRSE